MSKRLPRGVRVAEISGLPVKIRHFKSESGRYPLVVLHGLTRLGYNDRRLNNFCLVMASLGFEVYAPNLAGLQNLNFDFNDIDLICEVIKAAGGKGKPRGGIIGFSFGASYGLIASSQRDVRQSVGFILAVDAIWSLSNVFEQIFSGPGADPYAKLVLDWAFVHRMGLSPGEIQMYKDIMDSYCEKEKNFSSEERRLIEEMLEPSRQESIAALWKERLPGLRGLSLDRNKYLEQIEAEVLLMHNKNDTLVSPSETLSIYKALRDNGKAVRCCSSSAPVHLDYIRGGLLGAAGIFYRIMCLRED